MKKLSRSVGAEYGWRPLADLLAEPNARDLILSYWSELSPIKEVARLDPDFQAMIDMEAAGRFKVWACHVDGTLAGFVAFHLIRHLNYRGTLFAIDGGHYLSPTFRDIGRTGFRLWRTAERALGDLGVKVIMAHDNASRPLMPFFLALGYEPRSTVFWRVIDAQPRE